MSGCIKPSLPTLQASVSYQIIHNYYQYKSGCVKRKHSSSNQRINSVDSKELTMFLAMSKYSSMDEKEMSASLEEFIQSKVIPKNQNNY